MGGWMTYQRMRNRSGLMFRKPPDEPPCPSEEELDGARLWQNLTGLIGDMNRMERDYLDPEYPEPPYAARPAESDPLAECARETGVDVETVRKVLRYVFMEQR